MAGLASLVSYPALLAAGLSPVSANVTNTVSLVFSGMGSVWGFRPELRGQVGAMRRLVPFAIAGGMAGGLLLLLTPSTTFARLVPWLIGAASLAVVVPRRLARPAPRQPRRSRLLLSVGVFSVALYGGYFGAAAGVLLLALLLVSTVEPLPRAAALRNLLLGSANAVAAVAFIVWGPVRWSAAVPLGLGFLAGGRLGPFVVRRVPAAPLRALIACAGLGLAVHLGLDAYR